MSAADPVERWRTFVGKVLARCDEVLSEAEMGFDELIAADVLNGVPLASALSEFHARMLGLQKKIDEGWEKLEPELPPHACETLRELGRQAARGIESKSRVMQVRKQAKAAHALFELAQAEMRRASAESRCSNCGASVRPGKLHEPCNASCAHCGAVSVLRPGLATLSFFQGVALHALGEEAALPELAGLEAAQERYQSLRSKRKADVEAWVEAHRRYWHAYARGYGRHVPEWNENQALSLAEAKLGALKWELERVEVVP